MRLSEIRHRNERLASKGVLTEDQAKVHTLVNVYEHATLAFLEGYAGRAVVAQAREDVRSADLIQRRAMETHAPDVMALQARLARESITTTLDLPAIAGRVREIILRPERANLNLVSPILAAVEGTARVVPNFELIETAGATEDEKELFEQPEGTNVQYDTVGMSEDDYSVSLYSVAHGLTYQARKKDDIGFFLLTLRKFGERARRTRILTALRAISDVTGEQTPSGTMPSGGTAAPGGPSIANVEFAAGALAANDRVLGSVTVPAKWLASAEMTSRLQVVPTAPTVPNSVMGFGVNLERNISNAAANFDDPDNWLAHESDIASWLEFAVLDDFAAGPVIVYKLADADIQTFGSFDNLMEAFKVMDAVGAKVYDSASVVEIKGH